MIREPVGRAAKNTIGALFNKGARRTREMERHLEVPNEDSMRRKFLPRPSDIRNIIHSKKAGSLSSPYDQENLSIFLDARKKSHPGDLIHYRVRTGHA